MSEMVERVARAAYFAGEGTSLQGAFHPANDAHWAYWWQKDREEHEAIARAAIEVMREPTEAMCDAANALDRVEAGVLRTAVPFDAWTAMIDEALKPTIRGVEKA